MAKQKSELELKPRGARTTDAAWAKLKAFALEQKLGIEAALDRLLMGLAETDPSGWQTRCFQRADAIGLGDLAAVGVACEAIRAGEPVVFHTPALDPPHPVVARAIYPPVIQLPDIESMTPAQMAGPHAPFGNRTMVDGGFEVKVEIGSLEVSSERLGTAGIQLGTAAEGLQEAAEIIGDGTGEPLPDLVEGEQEERDAPPAWGASADYPAEQTEAAAPEKRYELLFKSNAFENNGKYELPLWQIGGSFYDDAGKELPESMHKVLLRGITTGMIKLQEHAG